MIVNSLLNNNINYSIYDMKFYIDEYVENFLYGKGKILEIYRNLGKAVINFERETDGIHTRTVDIKSIYKVF